MRTEAAANAQNHPGEHRRPKKTVYDLTPQKPLITKEDAEEVRRRLKLKSNGAPGPGDGEKGTPTEPTGADDRGRYLNMGEAGRNVVTPLKQGEPIKETPSGPSTSSSLPAIVEEECKPIMLSKCDEIANLRCDLVRAIEGAILAQKHLKKGEIIKQCLAAYNMGIFLPDIHKRLGSVSRSTFYEWKKAFNQGSIEKLAPAKGRKGESKITDDERNYLFDILYNPENPIHIDKIGTAIRFMKYFLNQEEIPSPSGERTLRRFVKQFEKEHHYIPTIRRDGEKGLNDKDLPYLEGDRNRLRVGQVLVADGHRLNFQVINPFTGKPCRPAIVVFLDRRSSYPLGWEIMLEESVQCIASALRNAIVALGRKPEKLHIDNGKAFKSKVFNSPIDLRQAGLYGMFRRLDIRTHFSQPYNPQAKPIERWFRTFTDWFERLMPSFVGSSIEDKPAYLKRNEKLARSMHDPWIPTIKEVNDLLPGWREFYVNQPSRGLDGKTPREIFEPGKGPGVNAAELAYLMMPMEIRNIGRNGINLFGCHWYDEALYGLRDRVLIKYSLSDLSEIYCFYKGDFLCTLKPLAKLHPDASESGTPKDMEDVKRRIAQKKSLKNQTVKLYKLFGKNQDRLPWKEIIEEAPNVIKAIEAEEAKKPPESKRITPWIDEPERIGTEANQLESSDQNGNARPRWEYDYEKYDWLMEQVTLTPADRKWIDDYRASSSLHKHKVFNDAEELDKKVALCEESKKSEEYLPAKDWSGFSGDWFERYDYHLKQDPDSLTQDDLDWIEWYRTTSEYQSIYCQESTGLLSGEEA